ncbi:MAG: alginate export family protein [Sphingomonas sp.]|nr:alginate export family protein [Sphingomonas sp.]
MIRIILATATAFVLAMPAAAQTGGDDEGADRVRMRPLVEARARYEHVDQGGLDAGALTIRLRAGIEARYGPFSLLAEAEGTLAPADDYNAFPFPIANASQRRPQFATVADPENAELNRLQLQYRFAGGAVTLGRQRINLDDQRWVGSVGWRQNEQTFDAVRTEARLGPVGVDLTYAVNQRTIFGEDAGPQTAFGGDFIFAGLSSRVGPIEGRLFAYLLDYDEAFNLPNSSQTYGGTLSGAVPLHGDARLSLRASYARQADHGRNPFDYAADYWAFEGGTTLAGFTIAVGWERLGSDHGRALQTPMATLHRYNGWADLFLTTPAAGLEDAYVSIGRRFDGVRALPGLNFSLAFHQFDSAAGNVEYGTEWDASVGFRLGRVALLAKYADYDARGLGADTRKLWLQAEWAF